MKRLTACNKLDALLRKTGRTVIVKVTAKSAKQELERRGFTVLGSENDDVSAPVIYHMAGMESELTKPLRSACTFLKPHRRGEKYKFKREVIYA